MPVDPLRCRIAPLGPGRDGLLHRCPTSQSLAQALPLQHAQAQFGHIQPTPVFRGVMSFQFLGEALGLDADLGGGLSLQQGEGQSPHDL